MQSLSYLDLSSNLLTGNVSNSLGNITNLSYIALYENGWNGTLPSEIFDLMNIEMISLFECNLTGIISFHQISNIGNAQKLDYLSLSNNQFTSSIHQASPN